MTGTATQPHVWIGPGAPAGWDWPTWAEARRDRLLVAGGGFDPAWERSALDAARFTGRELLSLRFTPTELLIGPLWTVEGAGGCAGCAHVAGQYQRFEKARRPERDRAERERGGSPAAGITAGSAFPVWLASAVGTLLTGAWRPGDLVALGAAGTVTRHRVRATFRCPVCAEPPGPLIVTPDAVPPPAPPLTRRPTTAAIPTRAGAPFGLDPDRMRAELGDPRFGPVIRMTRNSAGAFPMSEVELLAGTPAGIGRGRRFADAEVIGVLEAYERLGGYPHAAPIVVDATRTELGDLAIDPAGLGGYTDNQLAAPTCRIRPYHPDAPLDWVWARPLLGGRARLVPAEVGFYRYGYDLRNPGAGRRGCFLDSSSGSALGSSFEEAALHSLLELAERDAFLLAWHRARPLPVIDPATVTDPDSAMMLGLAADRGYQVHLLVATADIDVPVVWALAVRADGQLPASLSAAGCHPDPAQAVRSALWELSQMVSAGLAWDPEPLRPSVSDPWLVEDIPGHWRRYTFPELLPRVETVLGGGCRPLREAFDGWPDRLVAAAGGDVAGAVEYLADRYARAGLTEILAVDQSTPDHRALGLSVVKCVVPGIVPMCFGQAHQRLSGLPRLYADGRLDPADAPFDPHPFP
jgi:ribosomal protein S12 methylthiotransferase accessory factor